MRDSAAVCGSTLFEDIVKIIATTNTTWRQTMRMTELLVEKCGRRSRSGRAAFPEPADIVRFSVDELKDDCRMGYRAQYVHQLASGSLDGTINWRESPIQRSRPKGCSRATARCRA